MADRLKQWALGRRVSQCRVGGAERGNSRNHSQELLDGELRDNENLLVNHFKKSE